MVTNPKKVTPRTISLTRCRLKGFSLLSFLLRSFTDSVSKVQSNKSVEMKHLLISSPKQTHKHISYRPPSKKTLNFFIYLALKVFRFFCFFYFFLLLLDSSEWWRCSWTTFMTLTRLSWLHQISSAFFVKGTLNRYVMAFWSKYEKGRSHTTVYVHHCFT